MKRRIVLARREALLKLLEEEEAGVPDPAGTRQQALGALAKPAGKARWLAVLGAAIASPFRRRRRSSTA
jgi:hypothetical protein